MEIDEKIRITFNTLSILHYVKSDVPPSLMDSIRKDLHNIKKDNFKEAKEYNNYLVGNIEKEFLYKDGPIRLNNFLNVISKEYWKKSIFSTSNSNRDMQIRVNEDSLPDIWVNYMKAGEINAPHNHGGVLSFVIWVDIPYFIEEEYKNPSVSKSKSKVAGNFSFIFPKIDIPGGLHYSNLPIDNNDEGQMILFPSTLNHAAYPFYTSNEYRVSIAGNLDFIK